MRKKVSLAEALRHAVFFFEYYHIAKHRIRTYKRCGRNMMYNALLVMIDVTSMYMLMADAADQIFLWTMISAAVGSGLLRTLAMKVSRCTMVERKSASSNAVRMQAATATLGLRIAPSMIRRYMTNSDSSRKAVCS